jgi:hypothetical protein
VLILGKLYDQSCDSLFQNLLAQIHSILIIFKNKHLDIMNLKFILPWFESMLGLNILGKSEAFVINADEEE